jgi:HSP20 family protein
MTSIIRRDPFRDMMSLQSAMDRLLDSALVGPNLAWPGDTFNMATDIVENQDEYIVKVTVPGIEVDDLEITYNNNVLTIKGDVKEEKNVEESQYILRERRLGSLTRSFSLPSNVKAENIQAQYNDGILTLHLPKAEEAKPKRIPVQNPQMVEAKITENTN